MTVEEKRFRSASKTINFLDHLACESPLEFLFRGQTGTKKRLSTTMDRYWTLPHSDDDWTVNKMIRQYKDGLSRMGQHLPPDMTELDCLEHARHHGLPAPLLDFSWSPYVALFFSVNKLDHRQKKTKSVVYALNLNQLALHWVLDQTDDRGSAFRDLYDTFLFCPTCLRDEFPGDKLAVIRDPGPYSRRMQNQLGAFIFCTLNYDTRSCQDLEDYLAQIDEVKDRSQSPKKLPEAHPVLTKVFIKHEWATEIFQRLELLGVTGAKLFEDAEGVAADVCNSYHYVPKTAFLRRDVD